MSDNKVIREYTNGEVTVVWKPDVCIHSTRCFKGLPEVFDPTRRPWVNIQGAGTDQIVEQVRKCPSGALSYYMNKEEKAPVEDESATTVEMMKNGPLLIHGNITVKDIQGKETKHQRITAFCRCGSSQNKPYCDGSHGKIGFEG
jgi:uncharacterized Fe-S cluster protein YjdI